MTTRRRTRTTRVSRNLADKIKRLQRRGRKTGLKVLPFIAIGDPEVQEMVIGATDFILDLIPRKTKATGVPQRGLQRVSTNVAITSARINEIGIAGGLEVLASATRVVDQMSDAFLGDSPADALIDIPEEIVQDALNGLARISRHLAQRTIRTLEERREGR